MFTEPDYPYRALYRLSRELYRQRDVDRVKHMALSQAGQLTLSRQGCLITFKEGKRTEKMFVLDVDSRRKRSTALWETLLNRGMIGHVYHSQRTVVIRNIRTDPRWSQVIDLPDAPAAGSAIGVPIRQGDIVLGVLLLLHPQVDYYNESRVMILQEIAGLTASVMSTLRGTQARASIRYQDLFQDAVVPLLLTDIYGTILNVNGQASDLLGFHYSDLVNQPITLVHDVDLDHLGQSGLRGLRLNETATFRLEAQTSRERTVPVMVRIRRLRLDGRDCFEWLEQDITVQQELDQLRRDLMAMVYHDLRGPLQNISGSVQQLARLLENTNDAAIKTFLDISVQSTHHLRRLIDGLLDVQRLEDGHVALQRREVNLRRLLKDAVEMIEPVAQESYHSVSLRVDHNVSVIDIDENMILRVVMNLIENAVKHTPDGCDIVVSARVQSGRVRVSVKDNGPGIPVDKQRHIFEKFRRIDDRRYGGVGLGLTFCQLTVEAHGGRIWVESKPSKGAEFIFTLPLQAERRHADVFSTLMRMDQPLNGDHESSDSGREATSTVH